MNEYGEFPPSYEEKLPGEATPLLDKPPQRLQRHKVRILVVALLFSWLVTIFILFHLFNSVTKKKGPEVPVRIAVIGAGPAGVSAAFSLSKLATAKGSKISVTIFEQKNGVGGRMLLNGNVTIHSRQEPFSLAPEDVASGNLLHNRILRERDAKFLRDGYAKQWNTLTQSAKVGFYDGEKIISVATRPIDKSSWGEWLARFFRYGASVWSARKLPTGTMNNFQNFLNLGGTHDSVGDMLAASENLGPVSRSALNRLKLNGLSQKYVQEVLDPEVKRHTGQRVEELSDLAMSMALEREDQGVQKSEVGGRLTNVLDKFITKSQAALRLNTKVTGLRREMVEEGKELWIVESLDKSAQSETIYDKFDKVIIAAPLNAGSILSESPIAEQLQYRSTWLAFLVSNVTLSTKHFGNSANMPAQILPLPTSKLPSPFQGVQEIVHLKAMNWLDDVAGRLHTDHIYRVVSDQKLDVSILSSLFEDSNGAAVDLQEEIEHAYPLLYPRSGGFLPFKVTDGVWHTSVIEAIGSSVDLSWMAGENVAKLVVKQL